MKRVFLLLILFLVAQRAEAQFYKDLEFRNMKNFTYDKEGEVARIGFDYVIYNPNWYNIVIKPSTLRLTIAGQDCGWVEVDKKVKIKKKIEAAYPFVLVGESSKFMKSAFSSLWSMLTGKGIDFNIQGKLKAGALILRKKWAINYTYSMSYEEFISFF